MKPVLPVESQGRRQDGHSLGRVLEVLSLFSGGRSEISLSDIAAALGWPVPTTHRVTATLVEREFLARDPQTKQFRLGVGVVRLVAPLLQSFRLPELAQEPLRELAAETGETVNLAILDGAEVLYLASFPGTFRVRAQATPGVRLFAHCTALGKCLLAQLDPEEARRRMGPGPYPRLTSASARRWSELAAMLATARADGYAISVGEYESGLLACAVPVQSASGIVAAINVAVPETRLSAADLIDGVLPKLRASAATIDSGHLAQIATP